MDTEHMSDAAAYAEDAARRLRRELAVKDKTIDALAALLEKARPRLVGHNKELCAEIDAALALARGGK